MTWDPKNIPPPSPLQLRWQKTAFGMFCHFGINTFHNREWSSGQLPPESFNPARFDPDQWVDTAKQAGMKYLILTTKHHDGFCLWPTATTAYSVASSPFRHDVVREVGRACERAGLRFGIYLSPWDRNAACYDNPKAYDDFYIAQMTELCTGYGEFFEIWLDGAGSEGRHYDWSRIMAVIDRYQPQAVVFNMGRPTTRWIGNEDGLAADPCLYTTTEIAQSAFTGSTDRQDSRQYIPPECDVAIRRNWFWQDDDLHTLKSRDHLLAILYRSIGYGANLLLNLGPNRDGLLDPNDVTRLHEATGEINRRFSQPTELDWHPVADGFECRFPSATSFDHVILREDITKGQRVFGYRLLDGETGIEITSGKTIGIQKWHAFPRRTTISLRLVLSSDCAPLVRIAGGEVYLTGVESPPDPAPPLDYGKWGRKADPRDAVIQPWRPFPQLPSQVRA